MSFNENKAFELEDGLIINDGAGLFSGTTDPTDSAPNGSLYVKLDSTKLWQRISGVWTLIHDTDTQSRNSVALFISDVNGENIGNGSYTAITFKPVAGPDLYLNSAFKWGVVGETSNGGGLDVRIVVKSTGSVLGTLTWTDETTPTLKVLAITPPNGTNILELQARRQNGNARIYSSGIEVIYG